MDIPSNLNPCVLATPEKQSRLRAFKELFIGMCKCQHSRGMIAAGVAFVFTLSFTIIQYIAFVYLAIDTELAENMIWPSILMNVAMVFIYGAFLLFNGLPVLRRRFGEHYYYFSLLILIAFIYLNFSVHTYFAGTGNSVLIAFNLCIFLLVSWLLKWRHAVMFFWMGHLILAATVLLEQLSILPYAPLYKSSQALADIYIDWHVMGMTLLIYMSMASVVIITVSLFKKSVDAKTNALEKALAEVKRLEGLLPICSYCKKIRDEKGNWHNIENFISRHSEAKFTHGLCQQCVEEQYGLTDL